MRYEFIKEDFNHPKGVDGFDPSHCPLRRLCDRNGMKNARIGHYAIETKDGEAYRAVNLIINDGKIKSCEEEGFYRLDYLTIKRLIENGEFKSASIDIIKYKL